MHDGVLIAVAGRTERVAVSRAHGVCGRHRVDRNVADLHAHNEAAPRAHAAAPHRRCSHKYKSCLVTLTAQFMYSTCTYMYMTMVDVNTKSEQSANTLCDTKC